MKAKSKIMVKHHKSYKDDQASKKYFLYEAKAMYMEPLDYYKNRNRN